MQNQQTNNLNVLLERSELNTTPQKSNNNQDFEDENDCEQFDQQSQYSKEVQSVVKTKRDLFRVSIRKQSNQKVLDSKRKQLIFKNLDEPREQNEMENESRMLNSDNKNNNDSNDSPELIMKQMIKKNLVNIATNYPELIPKQINEIVDEFKKQFENIDGNNISDLQLSIHSLRYCLDIFQDSTSQILSRNIHQIIYKLFENYSESQYYMVIIYFSIYLNLTISTYSYQGLKISIGKFLANLVQENCEVWSCLISKENEYTLFEIFLNFFTVNGLQIASKQQEALVLQAQQIGTYGLISLLSQYQEFRIKLLESSQGYATLQNRLSCNSVPTQQKSDLALLASVITIDGVPYELLKNLIVIIDHSLKIENPILYQEFINYLLETLFNILNEEYINEAKIWDVLNMKNFSKILQLMQFKQDLNIQIITTKIISNICMGDEKVLDHLFVSEYNIFKQFSLNLDSASSALRFETCFSMSNVMVSNDQIVQNFIHEPQLIQKCLNLLRVDNHNIQKQILFLFVHCLCASNSEQIDTLIENFQILQVLEYGLQSEEVETQMKILQGLVTVFEHKINQKYNVLNNQIEDDQEMEQEKCMVDDIKKQEIIYNFVKNTQIIHYLEKLQHQQNEYLYDLVSDIIQNYFNTD